MQTAQCSTGFVTTGFVTTGFVTTGFVTTGFVSTGVSTTCLDAHRRLEATKLQGKRRHDESSCETCITGARRGIYESSRRTTSGISGV
jgi:hypothetical protein